MKKFLSEEQEQRLTERFEQGCVGELSALEKDAIRSYAKNQDGLRTVPIPDFDAVALSHQMREKMRRRRLFSTGFRPLRRYISHPAPVFVGATVVLVLAIAAGLLFSLTSPVIEATIASDFTNDAQNVSWWQAQQLRFGRFIQVPAGFHASIRLADESMVSCSSKTRIAVRFDSERHIFLDEGIITIDAAKDPKFPMIVETPLGNIRVVGTVFTVEVIK
ncbi:MAG: FecR family protein [bacterium]